MEFDSLWGLLYDLEIYFLVILIQLFNDLSDELNSLGIISPVLYTTCNEIILKRTFFFFFHNVWKN